MAPCWYYREATRSCEINVRDFGTLPNRHLRFPKGVRRERVGECTVNGTHYRSFAASP